MLSPVTGLSNWLPERFGSTRVAPGYVETDMTAEYFADEKILKHAIERQPFGRLAHPDEVAEVVLFLCSPESNWITGDSINVSGGFVA